MKRFFVALAAALALLTTLVAPAQAAIIIEQAVVSGTYAFVKGKGADKGANITWEGTVVASANNKNGGFSFYGVLPADCTGALSDGTSTIDVTVLGCAPVAAGAPAPVAKTGQYQDEDTGGIVPGSDAALQKGVAPPVPRFTDNSNGTITDNLTGLIWLKNANCANAGLNWTSALAEVANLNSSGQMNGNSCGDTSNAGSHQTDWRLPNLRELQSLVDYGASSPALPAGHPFMNVQLGPYWSSTSYAVIPTDGAWVVNFNDGFMRGDLKVPSMYWVIAVRGGS